MSSGHSPAKLRLHWLYQLHRSRQLGSYIQRVAECQAFWTLDDFQHPTPPYHRGIYFQPPEIWRGRAYIPPLLQRPGG